MIASMPKLSEISARLQLAVGYIAAATPPGVNRRLAGKPLEIDGQLLHPDAAMMVRATELLGLDRTPQNIEEERAQLVRGERLVRGPKIAVGETRELEIDGAAGKLGARLYVPAGATAAGPLAVYFHGGGYALGDLESHDQVCRFICKRAQMRVLAVEYRIGPENPFPAAVDDGLAAFDYAVVHAAELGADPEAITVAGDSAGGGLATVTTIAARDRGAAVPSRQMLIYPVCDPSTKHRSYELFGEGLFLTEEKLERWFGYYLTPEQRSDPRAAPLLTEDLSNLPPAHFLIAGFDPLRDEGLEYAERLRAAGNEVTVTLAADLIHAFVNAVAISDRFAEAFGGYVDKFKT